MGYPKRDCDLVKSCTNNLCDTQNGFPSVERNRGNRNHKFRKQKYLLLRYIFKLQYSSGKQMTFLSEELQI